MIGDGRGADRNPGDGETGLIPRSALFGNPDKAGGQISPDGKYLSWVAPVDGVLNIWIAPFDARDQARPLTHDRRRGIQRYLWTYKPGYIVFIQDKDGDENWHIHGLDIATGETRDLTPYDGVQANLAGSSPLIRDAILVTHNQRDRRFGDLFRLNLDSGELSLVEENPGFGGFITDRNFVPRLATKPTPEGGMALVRRDDAGAWQDWIVFSPDETTSSGPILLVADGSALLMRDSRGRNTAALTRAELASGRTEVIAQDARADIGGLIVDQQTLEPLAYSVIDVRLEYHGLDARLVNDIRFLDSQRIGEWSLMSQTEDDRYWVVGGGLDVRPGIAWLYDRIEGTLTELYRSRPALESAPLVPMHSCRIDARDGLSLVSYLTLPRSADPRAAGIPDEPLPLVLNVHGGPHMRDFHGYDPTHQWLANRGYAVLSVNFRGSSGFGKAHYTAGNGEWGGRMQDDLNDAVAWAIEQRIADPGRIAIMGGSYGGYAALTGLTRDPELFACGVDIVGPSNLETLIASIPPYWEAGRLAFYRSVGDPRTPEGATLLKSRSPLHRAGAITRPLLVAHGANDPRVKQAEADQMVAAMKANGIPVTYVLFPDEGHGFARPPNRMVANAIIEGFLARHLGGRCEPVTPRERAASTAQVLEGGEP